jgi:hypothetical protein
VGAQRHPQLLVVDGQAEVGHEALEEDGRLGPPVDEADVVSGKPETQQS